MREKKLNARALTIGAIVSADSIELVVEFEGPDAAVAASDAAQEAMAMGAEVTIFDPNTDMVTHSKQFAGNGDGKWDEMRADAQFKNGRFKQVYRRTDMIQ